MACCPTEEKYGYEDCRFEKDVDENFHCSICYNVLKEPRTCRNNDHIFCLACITQHLKVNSQTCPECNEHLSVHTLRRPRVLNNMLCKLKINCDHASRGCPQFTCLEDLKTHVVNCGYAPVLCSNAECGMEINKQDKVHHETEVCDYRKVKCHDCEQIREDVGTLKGSLIELDGKVEQGIKKLDEK
ncbi:E3 ubiquitin- ligase NRDP1, partial [Paramuricea clavata]